MTFRPTLWPTVFSLPAFIVLLGLGTWQVERLHWKEGLIAARQAGVHAAPGALPATLEAARPLEFHPVRVAGELLNERELYLAATSERGTIGKQVFTPLRLDDGGVVLVNRGFVPDERKDPAKRAEGLLAGPIEIEGLLRLPTN